jgi:peptide/nickel transport system substrate-binding protein
MPLQRASLATALLLVTTCCSAAATAPDMTASSAAVLRVAAPNDLASLDPAIARPLSYATWFATCATLTAFRDAPAPAGLMTRPGAAAELPKVSRDGRTYVFTIRRGLRFSDGSPLTAANFKTALDRVKNPATQSYGAHLFSDVERVRAKGRRLVIELRKRSGDLLTRLALPFACPVPLGFPVDPAGVPLMIGSGPYYVAQHEPDRLLVLERNPSYRGRRPHRVERVVITIGGDLDDNIRSVEQGEADVLGIEMPRDVRDRLAARYGVNRRQLFRTLGTYTGALVFNTSRPLFRNNIALRKAVNYALDRRAIGRVGGGWPRWFRATDQILPRDLPGWTDDRLYPLAGADIQRARRLAAGHLGGGKAVLYTCTGRLLYARYSCVGLIDQANVIVQELKQIGLDVEVKVFDVNVAFARAGTPGEPYDLLLADFGWDYADPASMIVPMLAGRNARKSSANTNFAYFDKPSVNKEIAAATRLVGARRFRAFSRFDASVMRNQSPWAPLFEGSASLFLSRRVGCLKVHPVFERDYAAMCVR